MVKDFWKGNFPYILLWKLMLKSYFHTFSPYRAKNILKQFCRSRWALKSWRTINLNSMVVSSWKIKLKQFCHTFPIHFYTLSIVKFLILNFSWNLLNWLENSFQRTDTALHALQLVPVCRSNLNSMMASFWKIQLKYFSHTFPIHFQ